MSKITFAQLVKVILTEIPDSTQEEKLSKLFDWLADSSVNRENITISKTTASRILNDKGFSKAADSLKNRFKSEEEFEKALRQSITDDSLTSLSDWLNKNKITDGSKKVYPSTAPKVIYKELEEMITDIALNKTSSKFLGYSGNSQNTYSDKAHYNSMFKDISDIFIARFPDSKEFQNSFSVLATHSNKVNSEVIKIDKRYWQTIKGKINKSLLIVTRVRYTLQDTVKQNNHPFVKLANEELPVHIDDEENYNIRRDKNGIAYYIDQQGRKLKKDDKPVKAFKTIAELNPPIPDFAYLCEITSSKELKIPDSDNLIIQLTCHQIAKIHYNVIWNYRQYFGIPDDIFFNSSNDNNYQYISNIDILNRLKRILIK